MAFSRFRSGRQRSQLQAQKATLGSGTGASECGVWDRHAMVFSRFGSGRQSSHLQAQKATFGSGTGAGPACHLPVWEAAAKAVSCTLQRLVSEWPQKATLGTGSRASEALSRPACHGVFPFRKRLPKQLAALRKRHFKS